MKKSRSVDILQRPVPPPLDNALGSPHWKRFKTELTNIKGSLSTRITQVLDYELDFVKDLGNRVS